MRYSFCLRTKSHIANPKKVVLANGSLVNANAQSNPDLWWALKGGGNNFGKHSVP